MLSRCWPPALAGQVARGAEQLEIGGEQARVDGNAAAPPRIEQVPQDVRLQRVDRDRQLREEVPDGLEERMPAIAIELEIDERAGRHHPAHHSGDPAEVTAQLAHAAREGMQLIERELLVDRERPEAAAVLDREIVGDEAHQLGLRRVGEAPEEDPAARGIEAPVEELVHPLVGDLREVGVVVDGLLEQRDAIERPLGDLRGAPRVDLLDLLLVPVADPKLIAELLGHARGCNGSAAQQLTQLELVVAGGMAVPFGPAMEDLIRGIQIARVLRA